MGKQESSSFCAWPSKKWRDDSEPEWVKRLGGLQDQGCYKYYARCSQCFASGHFVASLSVSRAVGWQDRPRLRSPAEVDRPPHHRKSRAGSFWKPHAKSYTHAPRVGCGGHSAHPLRAAAPRPARRRPRGGRGAGNGPGGGRPGPAPPRCREASRSATGGGRGGRGGRLRPVGGVQPGPRVRLPAAAPGPGRRGPTHRKGPDPHLGVLPAARAFAQIRHGARPLPGGGCGSHSEAPVSR